MAEPKTQPSNASVAAFLAAVADPQRRADCKVLLAMMRAATGEPGKMWGASIVGFGSYRYRYASGREGEWPVIGFSPRKGDLTVYLMPGFAPMGEMLSKLGKHKTGKSCLYLKRLAEVDVAVLKSIVELAVKAMAGKRVS